MESIRRERKAAGLTMKELAAKIGCAESTISHYETGRNEPDFATLNAIADALGCTVERLLGLPEKPRDFTDFTFAMHHAEKDLTENDKAILLQMAQRLAEASRGK